jgi:hypothetical protein
VIFGSWNGHLDQLRQQLVLVDLHVHPGCLLSVASLSEVALQSLLLGEGTPASRADPDSPRLTPGKRWGERICLLLMGPPGFEPGTKGL